MGREERREVDGKRRVEKEEREERKEEDGKRRNEGGKRREKTIG